MSMNYLNNSKTSGGSSTKASSSSEQPDMKQRFTNASPDDTIHTPPWAHMGLGLIGMIVGFGANVLQWFTTLLAVLDAATPNGTKVDHSGDMGKLAIAVVIATSAQLGLNFLVWRIDSVWKNKRATENPVATNKPVGAFLQGYGSATIEVVQHIDLVVSWGLISFVIDTVGDFTFVSSFLVGVPLTTMIVLTFFYVIGLYALSTIGFVRSTEYIWASVKSAHRHYLLMQQAGAAKTTAAGPAGKEA